MWQAILWEFGIFCFMVLALMLAFLWVLLRFMSIQQRQMSRLNARLNRLEKVICPCTSNRPLQTEISITKDEPISKYKSVTLPDDIQISFVDKEEK